MKNKIVKVITIASFSALIVAFVAYRSGYFAATNLAGPDERKANHPTDAIPKGDSLNRIEMMSSSKVIILRDHTFQANDSNNAELDSAKKIDPLIYSSKSGIILKSEDLKKIIGDSIVTDTLLEQ